MSGHRGRRGLVMARMEPPFGRGGEWFVGRCWLFEEFERRIGLGGWGCALPWRLCCGSSCSPTIRFGVVFFCVWKRPKSPIAPRVVVRRGIEGTEGENPGVSVESQSRSEISGETDNFGQYLYLPTAFALHCGERRWTFLLRAQALHKADRP